MNKRESFFQKLNPYLICAFAALHIGLGIYYVTLGQPYFYLLSFCALLFIPLIHFVYKALRFQAVYQLNAFIYLMVFLLYTLGLILRWYFVVPYYDKIAHTLSGVLTSLLALVLFYLLKPGKKIETHDFSMASVFTVAVSIAVAGLWEISEYILSVLCHTDPQNVLTTGVQDTMVDMIVCTAGSLFMLIPFYFYYKKKKVGFIMGGFETMVNVNLQSKN